MSLVVKSSLEALIHQSELLDLVVSCLSVDGKSPQYESPHGWVASWRTRYSDIEDRSRFGLRVGDPGPRKVAGDRDTRTTHSLITILGL